MKAVRVHEFGGPEVLKVEEIADPVPGPGQVVIKACAIGVNPVDTYIRKGIYGPRQFPYVPGTDLGGKIIAVGEGVTELAVGDDVYTTATLTGAYAEQALADAKTVFPLPSNTPPEKGAALFVPYFTAYYGLFHRGGAKPGEIVLVHGASGGVGLAAVQLALAHGLTVIGTASTEEGQTLVAEQGVSLVLNHKKDGYLEELMAFTGGKGVNLILEMAAHINLGKDLTVLAKWGRVIVIGSRGPIEIDPRQTMSRCADIRGMTLMNATPEEVHDIAAAIFAGLRDDTLRPVIGKHIPLAEVARAHREIIDEPAYGKMVLIP